MKFDSLSISIISHVEKRCEVLGWLAGRFLLGGDFLGYSLFAVESLLLFLGVSFVVEFQKALQDFMAGGFADGEADALLGFVEVMAEFKIGPAVCGSYRLIHLDVQITELLNVGGILPWVVETIVELS